MPATTSTATDSRWADRLGMLNAFICLIHCLALPIVATIGSFSRLLLESIWLDITFIAISYFAVYRATRKTRSSSSTGQALWLWASIFAVALLIGHHGYTLFEYISYFASVMLAWTHFKHYRRSSCPSDSMPTAKTDYHTGGQKATHDAYPGKEEALS